MRGSPGLRESWTLGEGIGGAILGQLRAGQAAVHALAQGGELLQSVEAHARAGLTLVRAGSLDDVGVAARRLAIPGIRASMLSRSSAW